LVEDASHGISSTGGDPTPGPEGQLIVAQRFHRWVDDITEASPVGTTEAPVVGAKRHKETTPTPTLA